MPRFCAKDGLRPGAWGTAGAELRLSGGGGLPAAAGARKLLGMPPRLGLGDAGLEVGGVLLVDIDVRRVGTGGAP